MFSGCVFSRLWNPNILLFVVCCWFVFVYCPAIRICKFVHKVTEYLHLVIVCDIVSGCSMQKGHWSGVLGIMWCRI